MQKEEEYRRRAEDCRALARAATSDEEREQLLKMADIWIYLAEGRIRMSKDDSGR